MHVSSEAVLIAVDFIANRTHGLCRSLTLVMVSRNVDVETVLVFHFSIAVLTPEFVVKMIRQSSGQRERQLGVKTNTATA